jgi:hypothetical protein
LRRIWRASFAGHSAGSIGRSAILEAIFHNIKVRRPLRIRLRVDRQEMDEHSDPVELDHPSLALGQPLTPTPLPRDAMSFGTRFAQS